MFNKIIEFTILLTVLLSLTMVTHTVITKSTTASKVIAQEVLK